MLQVVLATYIWFLPGRLATPLLREGFAALRHSRHLLQTFSGVDVKHQFRAEAPGPPCLTAPVTTTVLPRLLLQHPSGKQWTKIQVVAWAQTPHQRQLHHLQCTTTVCFRIHCAVCHPLQDLHAIRTFKLCTSFNSWRTLASGKQSAGDSRQAGSGDAVLEGNEQPVDAVLLFDRENGAAIPVGHGQQALCKCKGSTIYSQKHAFWLLPQSHCSLCSLPPLTKA
jgi:hypothetical protein